MQRTRQFNLQSSRGRDTVTTFCAGPVIVDEWACEMDREGAIFLICHYRAEGGPEVAVPTKVQTFSLARPNNVASYEALTANPMAEIRWECETFDKLNGELWMVVVYLDYSHGGTDLTTW